ncbi:MAG: hypothetical protein EP330_13995 [Deltaproteobacteria bacterium]|nr:MAG: hypothetical protein EP330_13995 [Deltaproteobacteria bacterium]
MSWLVWMLALGTTSAHARDVCRGTERQVSAGFDKGDARVVKTNRRGAVEVVLWEDDAEIRVVVADRGHGGETLPPGTSFGWALDNGTRVTFASSKAAAPVEQTLVTEYSVYQYTEWTLSAPLTVEAAHALATGLLTGFRWDESEGTPLKRRLAGQMGRVFACAAQSLGPLDDS